MKIPNTLLNGTGHFIKKIKIKKWLRTCMIQKRKKMVARLVIQIPQCHFSGNLIGKPGQWSDRWGQAELGSGSLV